MKKGIKTVSIACLFVISGLFGFIAFEQAKVTAADTWFVGSGPGNDSATIQGGIDKAKDGDTVFVYSGTYVENLTVNKSINLTGEDRDNTIIDGDGNLAIYMETQNNVNISGFTIINSGGAAVVLNLSNNNRIYNCNISSNMGDGLYFEGSSYNKIMDCIISNNIFGLSLTINSSNNTIRNCNFSENWYGIYLYSNSSYNIIDDCIVDANTWDGVYIETSAQNIITNCNISNNDYGIYLTSSNDNQIYNNNIISNNNQAGDDGANIWDMGYPTGGNYWDDHISPDVNNDGFVDDPRDIFGGLNSDSWPFAFESGWDYFVYNIDKDTWHQTIQDGHDKADPTNTLWIRGGTHIDNAVISKALTILGDNNATTTLDGGAGEAFYLSSVSNVNITKLTVTNCTSGMAINNSNDNLISQCNFTSNLGNGIWLGQSTFNNISGCNFISNAGQCIFMLDSHSNQIYDCVFTSTLGNGLWITQSSLNNISGCNFSSNVGWGIYLTDSTNHHIFGCNSSDDDFALSSSSYNNISYCHMSSSGILLQSSSNFNNIKHCDISPPSLGTCIDISGSSNNSISNCTLADGDYGVQLYPGSDNIIRDCEILSNNMYGVSIEGLSTMNNSIINCNFSGQSQAGIYISQADYTKIINCNVSDCDFHGIKTYSRADYLEIIDCDIFSNDRHGLFLTEAWYIQITNTKAFSNDGDGIYLLDSENGKVSGCTVYSNNEMGIEVGGSSNINITNCEIYLNNLSGFYLVDSSTFQTIKNCDIFNNIQHGIHLESSSNNKIIDCDIESNDGFGLNFYDSSSNQITHCDVLDNFNGTYLNESTNNYISHSRFISNDGHGISILSSSGNTITINNISENTGRGTSIYEVSTLNLIYHNNILNNGQQAYDDTAGSNLWDNGYGNPFDPESDGGNFWSNYNGDDLNSGPTQMEPGSDGIGDIPYPIPGPSGMNEDHYPLINSVDTTPPKIKDLQPPDNSGTDNKRTEIRAEYSDPSGIDTDSVILLVDGENVTVLTSIYSSYLTYTPTSDLVDGEHSIYLEVKDGNGNLASISWSFFVQSIDLFPPQIRNLHPLNSSTTNDNMTVISSEFWDSSGVDTDTIIIIVDGVNVTSSAIRNESGVAYQPQVGEELFDGSHTVYVEVADINGYFSNKTWWFTVDSSPTIISNLQPPDTSMTNDNLTSISADYIDASGIDTGSVVLIVDSVNVTSSAIVTASGVTYTPNPGSELVDGTHTVYLEVKDVIGNLATETWWFTVDTTPPTISNLQPADSSIINNRTPVISADYTDDISGIDTNSVILTVDGINETSSSSVSASSVSYTPMPGSELDDGTHTVHLEVKDMLGNYANVTWWFEVEATEPAIIDIRPQDASTSTYDQPQISAEYDDPSDIDTNSVVLIVDGSDVTSVAIIGTDNVTYTPPTALSQGEHFVYLEVGDIHDNLANLSWSFIIDSIPPTVTNLTPENDSITKDDTPIISAEYEDISGINTSRVKLLVDGIDKTSSAVVTENGVTYTPSEELDDGAHTIYLEVQDMHGNLATQTWSFSIDATKPDISDMQPPDDSSTNDNTPTISANYTDSSGIDVSSVSLSVDSQDVTSSALVTASYVQYTPSSELADGQYTVYLEVEDIIGNLATVSWSFSIESTPPSISNLQPADGLTIIDDTPTIGADYSDVSGIDTTNVILKVDGIDVTSFSIMTESGITYSPSSPLSDGEHTVYLEVDDNSPHHNEATMIWSFIVNATTTGSILGIVRDEEGNPIEGATVEVIGTGLSAETDENGYYIIEDVPEGDHTIKIFKDGYKTITQGVHVDAGEDNTVDMELAPTKGEEGDSLLLVGIFSATIIVIIVLLLFLFIFKKRKEEKLPEEEAPSELDQEYEEVEPSELESELLPDQEYEEVEPSETEPNLQPDQEYEEVEPSEVESELLPDQEYKEAEPSELESELLPDQEYEEVEPSEEEPDLQPDQEYKEAEPSELESELQPDQEYEEVEPQDEEALPPSLTSVPVTVQCPNCNTKIKITSPERPIEIVCPTCGTLGVVD